MLESIFPRLLERCLALEEAPEEWIGRVVEEARTPEGSRAFFARVIEPLADSFDPGLAGVYQRMFRRVIARVAPGAALREPSPPPEVPGEARRVFVLSRVTLGADVAITSVILDGAKKRFPEAEIRLVGGRKSAEMFAADPRIQFLEAPYQRTGLLEDRLAASFQLREMVDQPGSIVIDPDSRLTQLGLIPVCGPERYFHFESRSAPGSQPLSVLAAEWFAGVFGVSGARAFVAPVPSTDRPDVTVSLGVGENPAKGLGPEFERAMLELLEGSAVLIDEGAGGEEADRARRAMLPGMRTFRGSFADFAARIANSRLYVGYDSAGQHAAAACGVPLITVFQGFPNEKFLERWRPSGPGAVTVVRGDAPDVLGEVRSAMARYLSASTSTSPQ
ncbi:MAG: hypothetical protein K2X35_11930 [Bryobacteraceae bacterium]|nr:hypothetical protein [Bryobacteraceae bacterium]